VFPWSRTLADQFPGVSEPILNASFGGRKGSTIEPDLHLVLDRVGRWSLDDVE
jgi:hypothetical protein